MTHSMLIDDHLLQDTATPPSLSLPRIATVKGNFSFLSQNFHLFGFDSPVNSVIQSIRELVDNSVDACRRLGCNGHITVILDLTMPHKLLLEVSDNGTGMDDIDKHLQIFSSSDSLHDAMVPKTMPSSGRIGRYGVGLSATIIHSLLSTHHPVEVFTKLLGQTQMQLTQVILGEEHKEEIRPQMTSHALLSHNEPSHSGTTLRLALSPLDKEALEQVSLHIEDYFGLIISHPHRHLDMDYCMRLVDSTHNFRMSYYSDSHMNLEEFDRQRFVNYVKEHLMPHNEGVRVGTDSRCVELAYHRTATEDETSVVAIMMLWETIIYSDSDANNSFQMASKLLPMTVSCLVNGKPLPCDLDCALLKAVKQCRWKHFNLRLTLPNHPSGMDHHVEVRRSLFLPMQLEQDEAIDCEFRKEECNLGGSNIHKMYEVSLFLYYDTSSSVYFADLKKTKLHDFPKDHNQMAIQAITKCCEQLAASSSPSSTWFICTKQLEQLRLKKQARQLSQAVLKIVKFSQDASFKAWVVKSFSSHSFDFELSLTQGNVDENFNGAALDFASDQVVWDEIEDDIAARIIQASSVFDDREV
eukprot:gene10294-11393_t